MKVRHFPEFLTVPTALMMNEKLSPSEKSLAIMLMAFMENGKAQVPKKYLAKMLKVNVTTVSKWLKNLVIHNVVEVVDFIPYAGIPSTYRFRQFGDK